MDALETISWLVLALVHLMPALAFLRPALLTSLYRLQPDNPLYLLMHHRAALFLAVFVACVWSAFDTVPRPLGVVVVAISMLGFLLLYWRSGSPKPLSRIARADMIGLPALAFVAWEAFAG